MYIDISFFFDPSGLGLLYISVISEQFRVFQISFLCQRMKAKGGQNNNVECAHYLQRVAGLFNPV